MLASELVRSMLDSAPDAMVIIDEAGAIAFSNHQVTALFGYESNELKGQRVEILLPERFRARHITHRQSYTRSVRVRPMGIGLDLFALRKDGTEFPVEISLSPMQSGGQTLAVAAIRDVTDRRNIERQLQEARNAADRANQAKSRFLATASHDLRQPLQTLGLLNGAMRRMAKDPDLGEALLQSEQAISAMSRLLTTLLDISKLESGAIKPEISDFTVAEIFTELRNEFASLASAKGLQLNVDSCPECVRSDPSLVEQALRNLLANAIKYTRQGFVHLRCLHEQAFVRLEVLDTGIGIPADAMTHIYDEFYQVGVSTHTSRDGYGLGLSIVQRIVSLLNLKIEVRSELGKGSLFSLTVPASLQAGNTEQRAEGRSAPPAQRPAPARHILLVEDDVAVRSATRMLLKVEGYRVTTAGSLSEAIRCAAENVDIDLLLTDYHLANGETGTQVIAALRDGIVANLRAVLVTGDTSSAIRDLQRDENLRITSKPIVADELLSLLNELLLQ